MPSNIIEKVIDNFPYGVIDTIENKDIPDGAASKSLNWITKGDRTELRPGQIAIGTESTSSGQILGLRTAYRADGTPVIFRKNGQKLEYFIYGQSGDWAECGTNMFPVAAVNDDASIEPYTTNAGNMVFVSSPNGGIFKIMVANPGSFVNMSDSVKNFSGLFRMKITQNRMLAWLRMADKTGTSDRTGEYGSYIDTQSYTAVSNELLGTGDGTTKTFTGTLNCKTADPQSTAFGISINAPTGAAKTITAITRANNAQVTAAAHGLSVGDTVVITGLNLSNAGTGTITSGGYGATLVGAGTSFLTELSAGTTIYANAFTFSNPSRQQGSGTVGSISDNTHLTFSGLSFIDAGNGTFTYANMSEICNVALKVASVIDANNFTVNINSTSFHPYANGGTVTKTETILDDYNGNLSSASGATGTINYATGAYSFTLQNAATNLQSILASYQYENSNKNGITDFTKSNPRTAGQGFIFRQDDDASDNQNSFTYNGHEFCFHSKRTWDLNIQLDDTKATNLPYRARVGIPYWRCGVATSTGVYFINAIDLNNIKLQKLALNEYSTDIVPSDLSKRVNQEGVTLGVILDGYVFDKGAMVEYGDLILCACRTSDSPTNNRVIVYNRLTSSIDYVDYTVTCFTVIGSELWAGDSITPNVYRLFSGYDDNNSNIPNSWESKQDSLAPIGAPEENLYLKKCRRLVFQGLIAVSQSYNVYIATDGGDYTLLGTISGTGTYVDRGQVVSVNVGYGSIGSSDIGGSSDTVNAYNYERAFKLPIGKFILAKVKLEATGVGYLSVSRQRWFDIQNKALKILKQYQ